MAGVSGSYALISWSFLVIVVFGFCTWTKGCLCIEPLGLFEQICYS